MHLSTVTALAAIAAGTLAMPQVDAIWNDESYQCKCYPGDSCWPAADKWEALNVTVNGQLAVHIPPGAVCYETFDGPFGSIPTYDEAACEEAAANFHVEEWQVEQPGGGLWSYFTNDTCRPDILSPTCTLGNYGVYVLTALTTPDIVASINFARTYNLRLVIRNTGHDFIGRSVGWGSLIINTHSFQDIKFRKRWCGAGNYSGPAVTIGAGVQAKNLVMAGNKRNPPQMPVVGECPTVGVAGGLVQGGGHGPMTTLHGFTADTALEFEAITAEGEIVTANEVENPDLFWALKGGGPGTYAVVTKATLMTFEDQLSSGTILNINETHTTDPDVYWNAVRTFHKYANHFVDNGLYVYFEIGSPLGGRVLHVAPFVGIGKTAAELDAVIQPLIDELDAQEIGYDKVTKQFPTLHDLYLDLFEDEYAGSSALTGGWMFNHEDVATNNDAIVDAFQTVMSPREDLEGQGWMVGHLWNAGYAMEESNSATHPAFRDATNFIISILPVPVGSSLEEKADLQDVLTNTVDAALRGASNSGCTYVNEADPYQDNWQERFWGSQYPELKALKEKWDPNGLFYGVSMPGTEEWEVIEYGTRLCKKM